jgi:hypothetical protein
MLIEINSTPPRHPVVAIELRIANGEDTEKTTVGVYYRMDTGRGIESQWFVDFDNAAEARLTAATFATTYKVPVEDHIEEEPLASPEPPIDATVNNEGTVVQFVLHTEAAREVIDAHVETEPWMWLGNTLVVDHRYASGLISLLQSHGLEVEL